MLLKRLIFPTYKWLLPTSTENSEKKRIDGDQVNCRGHEWDAHLCIDYKMKTEPELPTALAKAKKLDNTFPPYTSIIRTNW